MVEQKALSGTLDAIDGVAPGLFEAIFGRAVVVDRRGEVVAVNQAWEWFARQNGDPRLEETGPGNDYLAVCRRAAEGGDEYGQKALFGLTAVLQGSLPRFSLDYPVRHEGFESWFRMQVTPLGHGTSDVMICHSDVTAARRPDDPGAGADDAEGSVAGQLVLDSITRAVVLRLDVAHAFVAMFDADGTAVTFVSHWSTRGRESGRRLTLSDELRTLFDGRQTVVYSAGVGDILPPGEWGPGDGVESLLSVPLISPANDLVGVLGVLDTVPLVDRAAVEPLLQFFGGRATAEVEHLRMSQQRVSAIRRAMTSEAYYHGLFDGSPDAVVVADAAGNWVDANDAALEMLGYKLHDFVGKPVSLVVQRDDASIQELVRAVFADSRWEGEARLRRRDGRVVTIDGRASLVRAPGGDVVVGAMRDVSIRRTEEARMADERARREAMIGAIPDEWLRVRRGGGIVEAKASRSISAFLRPPTAGQGIFDSLPADVAHLTLATIEFVLDTGQARRFRTETPAGEGMRLFEWRIMALDEEALILVRDVTEEATSTEAQLRPRSVIGVQGQAERQVSPRNPYHLTLRELMVLHLVAEGCADKEIAERLTVSIYTANKHVANILGKMQAKSRTEAAVRATREGLVG